MKTETKPYNPVDFLQNESEIIDYLNDAFMDEDPDLFIIALGHVAKHKGIAQKAADTGLNRESLYKTLSGKSKPKWDTVQRILKALHVQLKVAA
jgi:probable addiction module antidote protein